MRIVVKPATGRTEQIEVPEAATSDDLRQKVAQVLPGSIFPSQIQLLFGGKPIEDGSLRDIGIQDGEELTLVVSEKKQIEITVVYENKRIPLNVDAFESIENLKVMLSDKVGAPVDEQRLVFGNNEMKGSHLNHYKIGNGAEMQLVLRPIQIFVLDVKGKSHVFDVRTSDKVEHLQRLVQKTTGVLQNQQRLEFAGKQLEAGNELKYYNIQPESTIHMSLRLRGG